MQESQNDTTRRLSFIERFGPGGFSGTTFGDWLRILRENNFAIDRKYWLRAAFITSNGLLNSLVARWEAFSHGAAVSRVEVPPPLFVLGVWRSGTTHLHNLLAKDDRFAYPNTYEVLYPHTFLTTHWSGGRVMQSMMPPTRPMDNVVAGVCEPQEDEFALVACGLSFMLGLVIFPRSGGAYQRFLTLRSVAPEDRERWKSAFAGFLQKLTYKYQRPLILKSPAHTGRLGVLLELFPDAKFVHIHRDPYTVFQSSLHTWRKVKVFWGLQDVDVDEERVLRDYVELYDAFFAERHRLAAPNFCEVRFEDLEREPLAQMKRIYETLSLPDFGYVEPALRRYLETIAGYSRNRFPPLAEEMRQRVACEWSRSFTEWGYAK